MRAVGYVAPDRLTAGESGESDAGEARQDVISWSAVIEPSAGSWGVTETVVASKDDLPDGPAERMVRYCADNGHNLVAILGVEGGALAFEELIDVGGSVDGRPADDDRDASEAQFENLITALEPPAGHPALILLHDASHLADDVETLIRRLVRIRATGSDAQCTDPDNPDPLQIGLAMLPMRHSDTPSVVRAKDPTTAGVGSSDSLADTEPETGGDASDLGRGVARVIELASNGKVLGRTPYGYRSGSDGMLEAVAHEAQVVRQVFAWYVGDDDEGGVGMRSIVQRLTDSGVPTRSGRSWSTAAVSLMLKNKAYIGTYARYGFMVAGNHEPIISRATFDSAQQKMTARGRPKPPQILVQGEYRSVAAPAGSDTSDSAFLLGGFLQCADCGHGISGLTRKRSWHRKDGTTATRVYRYYEFAECPVRRGNRAAASGSTNNGDSDTPTADCPSWRSDELEVLVKSRLACLTQERQAMITPRHVDADLPERLAAAERRFVASVHDVAAGRGDLEHLMPDLDALDDLRRRVSEGRGSLSAAHARRVVRDHVANVTAAAGWVAERSAIEALVERVSVSTGDAEVVFRMRDTG